MAINQDNEMMVCSDACEEVFFDEAIDMRTVDWNRVWKERRAQASVPKRNVSFWDGRAVSFEKAASETDYADRFLSIINPMGHWTVLDMGCGSGTLAIPLAKRVKMVTAVDISPRMLSVVDERCKAEGVSNIVTIEGRWEDDWKDLGIRSCDLAVASRSMVVDDLRGAILKLSGVARRRVCIVTIVGDGPYDRRLFDAIGRPLDLGPDYIYTYNLLYQMGIHANVTFIDEKRNRMYKSCEEAVAAVEWMLGKRSCREEKRLRAYLMDYLVPINGHWGLSYERVVRWAAIWWDKATDTVRW
ncbi:MAG: Mg-protoporphyrin IX methyl transferase [Syntrophorhabdaceae bacterium PtaU1.Bin034]|nr:MAG: Mg-protoporphyrin IX methyl transferase [Syntrophorhabdaceae bacterium PtaU1.Bin034]